MMAGEPHGTSFGMQDILTVFIFLWTARWSQEHSIQDLLLMVYEVLKFMRVVSSTSEAGKRVQNDNPAKAGTRRGATAQLQQVTERKWRKQK